MPPKPSAVSHSFDACLPQKKGAQAGNLYTLMPMTGLMGVMVQTIPGQVLKKAEKFLPGFLRKKAEQRAWGRRGAQGQGWTRRRGRSPSLKLSWSWPSGAGGLAALPQGDTELTLALLHSSQMESGCGGQETPSSPSASSPLPVGFSKVNNAESISLRIVENVRGSRGPSGPPPPSTVQKVEAQSGSKLSVLPQSTWFVCGMWDLAPRFPDPGPGSDHHLTWPLVYPFNLETVAVDTRLSGSFRQIHERVLLRTGHG